MTDLVPVRRALISLSDKSGLDELAAGLARHSVELVSTGGTAAKLRDGGAPFDRRIAPMPSAVTVGSTPGARWKRTA